MQFLGLCSFFGVSDKMKATTGMGLAVVVVIFLTAAITYPLYVWVLEPIGLGYLNIIVFALVIAAVVQLTELVIKRVSKSLYRSLGIYLPLIATNCAVLGVSLKNVQMDPMYNYGQALVVALGTGIGYLLVMIIFSAIRNRLEASSVPKAFKGLPIAFITAALMALAFLGLSGIISI
jgi:electron transport complex protein RnfA